MLKFTTTVLIIVFVNLSFAQKIPVFVKKVFDDIYSTMDNGQVIKPNIIISNNIAEVASFTPTSNEIRIGTEFIKLARSFGKDSSVVIAHVLGHELAHVLLQQNDFVKKIGSGYASIDYNKAIDKATKKQKGRRPNRSISLNLSKTSGKWSRNINWTAKSRAWDKNSEITKLGGYGLLNLSTSYNFTEDLSVYLNRNNALDKDYEMARGYNTLGKTTTLGLTYNF